MLYLTLPANERLQFLAGQYLEIIMRDGKRRAYSMANPPEDDAHIELHVRNMANGAFTDYVFNKMKERDILRFEGPLGTFFLREDSDKPIIFLASGTGFAPIKSIVEHAFHIGVQRQMVLYWGARCASRPLHDRSAGAMAGRARQLQLHAGAVGPLPEDNWTGRTRLRSPRRDARLPRPVRLSGLCVRRPDRWSRLRTRISPRSAGCRTRSSSPTRSRRPTARS